MKPFWTVLKKELLDCLRDRRSLVMMVLPLMIFPLLLTFYNNQIKSADESLSERLVLATESPDAIAEVTDFLQATGMAIDITHTKDAITDLKAGKISLILNRAEDGYHIVYDQNSIKSSKALSIVGVAIEANKNTQIATIFLFHGESIELLERYDYTFEDVNTGNDNDISSTITVLGPMLIVMFVATGGAGIALDMFCGEKERGSLEGILSTQISRRSLYLAKTVTVLIFVCFSALISVGGYLIAFSLGGNDSALVDLGLTGTQVLLFFVVTGVFAFFTAAIISMLSLSAKTVKEGSLRINLFTLIPTVIGGASMYIETGTAPITMNLIPIINVINALKSIFIDTAQHTQLLVTVASTAFYGIIFLLIGYHLINSEKILDQ